MKKFKKLIKKENGSITITVVASMLFITTMITIAYFTISNKSNDQSKKISQVADSYKVTNSDLVQKYKDIQDKLNDITTMSISEMKSLGNTMFAKGTNTETIDTDGNKIIIPGGFKIVEEENIVTDKVENGFVIEDKNENQWVWIPVSSEDLAKMYVEDSTGWTMYGTSGNTSVNTKLRTRELTRQNTFILSTRELPRQMPGNTSTYREPDLLSENDTVQQYRTQAGFGDLIDMATKLKDDYRDMIDSVGKNGGFYIGRYEIGKNTSDNNKPQIKPGRVINDTNWYNIYAACKSFSNGSVQARMIWGCQWDQVCRFINEHGDKVNLDDSTTYGNFNNSVGEAAINSGVGNFNSTTGRNEAWKTNNIYDFAGNCIEFTQEAYITGFRAVRGRTRKWRWSYVFSVFS